MSNMSLDWVRVSLCFLLLIASGLLTDRMGCFVFSCVKFCLNMVRSE